MAAKVRKIKSVFDVRREKYLIESRADLGYARAERRDLIKRLKRARARWAEFGGEVHADAVNRLSAALASHIEAWPSIRASGPPSLLAALEADERAARVEGFK